MQLLDQHGHEVVIYGYHGEPYARILKDGTVAGEPALARHLPERQPLRHVKVPPSADPKAKPEWKTVDDSGTFIWHDHRMHYMSQSLPPQVKDKGTEDEDLRLRDPDLGRRHRRPPSTARSAGSASAGTSKLPFIIAAIVIVLGGGALVAVRCAGGATGTTATADDADRPSDRGPSGAGGEAW